MKWIDKEWNGVKKGGNVGKTCEMEWKKGERVEWSVAEWKWVQLWLIQTCSWSGHKREVHRGAAQVVPGSCRFRLNCDCIRWSWVPVKVTWGSSFWEWVCNAGGWGLNGGGSAVDSEKLWSENNGGWDKVLNWGQSSS